MSDDEEQFNPTAHKSLLNAISNLGKTQHIRKATRGEPVQQDLDEFHLVKGVSKGPTSRVAVNDIVQMLRRTKDHLDAGKQLKNVQSTKKVLSKPLEKPAAQRIKRTIGYDKAKDKLKRWDAIVARNRSAEQQVFPLPGETIFVDTSKFSKPVQLSVKSDLMIEMEAAEAKLKALRKERAGDFENEEDLAKREEEQLKKKLTRDELIARRKELAYLKMRESQKSAKARLKNKIKSKKYHKLMKKQKLQEQIKEFEILQKTNPEAALEKLNEFEKSRLLERASLRHKNTGTWAKNLQVRAKYDKDVRKDLSEALQKSRELTLKKDVDDGEDSEDNADEGIMKKANEMEEDGDYDPFNPWTLPRSANGKSNSSEEQGENWRKYWLQRNEHEKALQNYKQVEMSDDGEEQPEKVNIQKQQLGNQKRKKNTETETKLKKKKTKVTNGWIEEHIEESTTGKDTPTKDLNIDDLFDEQEEKIQKKLRKQLKILSKKAKQMNKVKEKKRERVNKEKDELQNLKDLSFKTEATRPIIDEELMNEELENVDKETSSSVIKETETTSKSTLSKESAIKSTVQEDTIDPTKVADVKLKQHIKDLTVMDDALIEADFDDEVEDPNAQHQMTISEAFEDDDIIADFSRDKTKDSELKNAEIQLSMPGWGSWAGAGLSQQTANSNKRFVLNLAKKNAEEMAKRRDDNKSGVYINEETSKHLRSHLVSDVPFPFTSAQEYEASIRAPIGRNFVPETAFRMLTRPAVITKKGAIIEPMDESELVKPQRRPRQIVDKRIAAAEKMNKKK